MYQNNRNINKKMTFEYNTYYNYIIKISEYNSTECDDSKLISIKEDVIECSSKSIEHCGKDYLDLHFNHSYPFNVCTQNIDTQLGMFMTYEEDKSDFILFWVIVGIFAFTILFTLTIFSVYTLKKRNPETAQMYLLESSPMINYSKY